MLHCHKFCITQVKEKKQLQVVIKLVIQLDNNERFYIVIVISLSLGFIYILTIILMTPIIAIN